MIVKYTVSAQADRRPGHNVGSKQTIRVRVNQFDLKRTPVKHRHQALAGNSKTVGIRVDQTISVSTPPIHGNDEPQVLADIREWLSSVEFGDPFDVELEERNQPSRRYKMLDGYTETRVEQNSDIFSFSFRMETV